MKSRKKITMTQVLPTISGWASKVTWGEDNGSNDNDELPGYMKSSFDDSVARSFYQCHSCTMSEKIIKKSHNDGSISPGSCKRCNTVTLYRYLKYCRHCSHLHSLCIYCGQ